MPSPTASPSLFSTQTHISRKKRTLPFLRILSWSLIGMSCVVVFFANLRFHEQVLAVGLEDDFFYYAQAAKNLVFSGASSFDGVHLTNGYHPLWFLIIAGITKIFGIGSFLGAKTIYPFAISIEILQTLIVIGTAYLSFQIASKFCSENVSLCIQLLTAAATLMQIRTGMETGLAIMMVLALVIFRIRDEFQWNLANSLAYGVLGSLAILSRLDVALIVGPMVVYDIFTEIKSWRARLQVSLAIVCGLLPLFGYLFSNLFLFHTLMPISGAAKQLRTHHLPALHALQTFLGFFFAKNSSLLILQVGLTIIAFFYFRTFSRRETKYRAIFLTMLWFPIVHLLVITSASDWELFLWYIYPWIISFVAAGIIVFGGNKVTALESGLKRYETISVYCCAGFLVLYALMVGVYSNPSHNLPYQAALKIKEFEKKHPGIYGMGDRAGVVGYFGSQPVIQLEGLMMDKNYLENIREKKDLMDVLRKYHVRYYVSTRAEQDKSGCWNVKEPWQAGPDSPAMRARICRTPLAILNHKQWTNQIFEIGGEE
ncbi:hypothetical protein [Edaphobacter albus]|uniref:hypothetical protein n=1 Tax=Edaphobacter sp. 4G125 TaxID=2763071 RepID=UPI0016489839|nr:hypothetical protein [Edaphobacter sp. 4G125]QNI37571.1 hypothetical protein H7846_04525 [Edaphobacter sp. 4G125]